MRMYWLDINYLMLWGSLRADLTSKSIGDPKAAKRSRILWMNEEMHNIDKYWIILLMNIHVYMMWL